jgi:hypothetical protein
MILALLRICIALALAGKAYKVTLSQGLRSFAFSRSIFLVSPDNSPNMQLLSVILT